MWGVLYLALGAPSGVVAFTYMVVSLASIGVFARTRNFELLLRTATSANRIEAYVNASAMVCGFAFSFAPNGVAPPGRLTSPAIDESSGQERSY